MEPIQIRMLGEFCLRAGDREISENDNRTKKIWLLLAYLVCHRGRPVSQKKLIELLWGDEPASNNPENALRITFHRLRTQLNVLWPEAGRQLILYKDNGYIWNGDCPATLDSERFEQLCKTTAEDPEIRLQSWLTALGLYRGDFLEKQSSEIWVIPISTHLHNLYVQTTLGAAELLMQQERYGEAAQICRNAVSSEPYHEELHRLLMGALAAQGERKAAGAVYDTLSRRLFDDFGIRPSPETLAVYREAAHSPEEKELPIHEVMAQLREPEGVSGAMECDYDYFKVLCHSESRTMERTGNVTHIVLMSISDGMGKPLSKRSLQRIMGQLGQQIRTNLRRGDTYSRCSMTQYIFMLPRANYENSCMVCRRVIGAFQRAHPHVHVRIQYMVQPLSPSISVP